MIPVSTLYDEYIDRRKLTEQKNPFEYIVPPPSRGVGTKKFGGKVLKDEKNCDPARVILILFRYFMTHNFFCWPYNGSFCKKFIIVISEISLKI